MTGPNNSPSSESSHPDPREQARRLALDALAAEDEEEALELAARALALDPDCADALLLQAQLGGLEDGEYTAALRNAYAAAERGLGQKFIEQHRGELAKQEKAHAYLRCRHQLALALIDSDDDRDLTEAIEHLQELIDLTGDDELGCRYVLMGSYLIEHDFKAAQALLDRFSDDQGLALQLGRAIVAFQQGRRSEAEAFLRQAQQKNRNLHAVLSRPETLARPIESEYDEGSPAEARHCLQLTALPLLDDEPELLHWLLRQTHTPGRNDACPCGSGKKYKSCCGRT